MQRLEIAEWRVAVDVERTRATYAAVAEGGWRQCGCTSCRNFGAVVLTAFPPVVLKLFRDFGIDPLKDSEVYDMGSTEVGRVLYEGEYHFWGGIERTAPGPARVAPAFEIEFVPRTQLAQQEFQRDGAVCLLFSAELPWVLEEEQP